MTWTVPTIAPVASSATSTTRSPRPTLADVLRQNASALARDIGSMKLTDAPPSTQSISTSLNPWISRSPTVCSVRIRMGTGTSSPRRTRTLGGDDHEVSRGLAGAVPKRRWLVERSEEHTSELQSRPHLVCRLLLEKKNKL